MLRSPSGHPMDSFYMRGQCLVWQRGNQKL
ncbi:hypothetical protein [Bacillus phage CP-51]|uniref:Uncharacterized protein n=1 Tax=Bacillus phage CP-51 TaxID=1391188 RepID=A0A068EQ78_9CAUD|nr:hypothetical protein OZ73_gp047 [Bacillus phage CP-51]AID50482.1 hypothetical protein [Bacillus phage CP-51]